MRKAIVLVGLPGSNAELYARLVYPKLHLFANLSKSGDLPSVEATLERGEDCVITDYLFCLEGTRTTLENRLARFGFQVEWHFFANDPEICLANVRASTPADKLPKLESFIQLQARDYHIPTKATILPIPGAKL